MTDESKTLGQIAAERIRDAIIEQTEEEPMFMCEHCGGFRFTDEGEWDLSTGRIAQIIDEVVNQDHLDLTDRILVDARTVDGGRLHSHYHIFDKREVGAARLSPRCELIVGGYKVEVTVADKE